MKPVKDRLYLYDYLSYSAIVEVLDRKTYSQDTSTVPGTPVIVFRNHNNWHNGILNLQEEGFVKEVSREQDPEYFL